MKVALFKRCLLGTQNKRAHTHTDRLKRSLCPLHTHASNTKGINVCIAFKFLTA